MAAEVPQGYHDIPEEDRKKAAVFFDRGNSVAKTGNFEYAIEMYLQGLAIDPDATEAHQTLRDISLKRKASSGHGKDLGMFEKMKLKRPGKDERENMLRAERLLAYDPGNTEHMLWLLKSAYRAGFYDTVLWMGPILLKANADSGKGEDVSKYHALRDIYVELKLWKQATDCAQRAIEMTPENLDLQRIVKDLGAMDTMTKGNYLEGDSFRKSVKNMEAQKRLFDSDKDIRDADVMSRQIQEAEAEYQADPDESGKLSKLVDALVRSESLEHENHAIDLLQQWYEKTGQFRYRLSMGKIKINQLRRQDRAELARLRQAGKAAQGSKDPEALAEYNELVVQYKQFQKAKNQEELQEYQLFSENYPTDMVYRFEWAVRLFHLDQHHEAIALFQQARSDPKLRVEAATYLGRAFMASGFADEAADTLKTTMDEYEVRGDGRSKELFYWYGNAMELKNDPAQALKAYSQLMQWEFNYRDIQARIKRLRSAATAPSAETEQADT